MRRLWYANIVKDHNHYKARDEGNVLWILND